MKIFKRYSHSLSNCNKDYYLILKSEVVYVIFVNDGYGSRKTLYRSGKIDIKEFLGLKTVIYDSL